MRPRTGRAGSASGRRPAAPRGCRRPRPSLASLLLRMDLHTDRPPGDDVVAVGVAVVGDALGELEQSRTALALPRLARLAGHGQRLADPDRPVVLEVLLGVERRRAATVAGRRGARRV